MSTNSRFRSAAEVVYVLCVTTLDSMTGAAHDEAVQPIIEALPEADVREALACLTGLFTASMIGLAGEGAEDLLRKLTIDRGDAWEMS